MSEQNNAAQLVTEPTTDQRIAVEAVLSVASIMNSDPNEQAAALLAAYVFIMAKHRKDETTFAKLIEYTNATVAMGFQHYEQREAVKQ